MTVKHNIDEGAETLGLMETTDGDVVIFDREEPNAWVQSDVTIDVST